MTIQIVHPAGVGEWPYGVVITVQDRRGDRLVRTGYAVQVPEDRAPRPKRKAKE